MNDEMDSGGGIVKRITVEREESTGDTIEVGQWYWVTTKEDKEPWLGCVTHVGSNYAAFESVRGEHDGYCTARIHFDEFHLKCQLEPNAQQIINENIEREQEQVRQLMGEVKQLTASLGVAPRQALMDGGETQALALRGGSQPVEEYKEALIKAKKEELPDLFKKIEKANARMAGWMKAPLIPLKAQSKGLEGVTGLIEKRIFNVELYAGLVEEVTQVREGEPASIDEPIYLFQRRAYMDEECLARYEVGGMDFRDISAFDKWMARPQNFTRLLPMKRCILAFKVRRYRKDREANSLWDYIKFQKWDEWDKMTFLYMRNGEQIFRLRTGIEFGPELFPDNDQSMLGGILYAKVSSYGKVDSLITEGHWLSLKEQYKADRKERADAIRELRRSGKPKKEWPLTEQGIFGGPRDKSKEYVKYDPTTVYFDDITKEIQDDIDAHNRLVLVLQGLLDRSPVFHPHPPYQLWNGESFFKAFKLIYDATRGLTTGDPINFEEYRAELNKTFKVGSICVGQQLAWMKREAEKENERRSNDWRLRGDYRELSVYKPYGDPGPGEIARVTKVTKKGCTFTWKRNRKTYNPYGPNDPIPCSITIPFEELMNVSAYTPGDFSLFFDDPRTRANYVKWAPFLLEAEEYWAGNRKVGTEPKEA